MPVGIYTHLINKHNALLTCFLRTSVIYTIHLLAIFRPGDAIMSCSGDDSALLDILLQYRIIGRLDKRA